MENRTAFGEMSKRQERTAVTVYGVIEVPADCPHLWQNWWIAERPLSGRARGNQPFVQDAAKGGAKVSWWWKAACPVSGGDRHKRTFVQKAGQMTG